MGYDGACQVYEGTRTDAGYGIAYLGQLNGRRVRVSAHRLAYALHHGIDPTGLVVMHGCDNPGCVNPAHLKLGTQSENIRDMYAKKRGRTGPSNFKLSVAQVAEIRRELSAGQRQRDLAELFGVDQSTVSNIATGRAWKGVL